MYKLFVFISVLAALFLRSCALNSASESIKLSPQVFKDSVFYSEKQIIDVRTAKEFQEGHIPNALNIDYNSVKFEDGLVLLDTTKPVFIYCRSGKRSARSVSVFKTLGFKSVYELEGGFLKWKLIGF